MLPVLMDHSILGPGNRNRRRRRRVTGAHPGPCNGPNVAHVVVLAATRSRGLVSACYPALPAVGDECAGCGPDVPIRHRDVGRMSGNKTAPAACVRSKVGITTASPTASTPGAGSTIGRCKRSVARDHRLHRMPRSSSPSYTSAVDVARCPPLHPFCFPPLAPPPPSSHHTSLSTSTSPFR